MAEHDPHAAPPTRYRLGLLLACIAAPLGLVTFHLGAYAGMPYICMGNSQPVLWAIALVSILLAITGIVAGVIVGGARHGTREDAPGPSPRGAFMGVLAALFGALLLLVLLGQAAATLILDACTK